MPERGKWDPPKSAPKGFALSFRPELAARLMARRKRDRAWGLGDRRAHAVRAMPCILSVRPGHRCSSPVRACHASARGMGGVKGDSGELFPACDDSHRIFGEARTSQRREAVEHWRIDPADLAAMTKISLDLQLGPEPCWRCDQYDGHSIMCPTMEAVRWRKEQDNAEQSLP